MLTSYRGVGMIFGHQTDDTQTTDDPLDSLASEVTEHKSDNLETTPTKVAPDDSVNSPTPTSLPADTPVINPATDSAPDKPVDNNSSRDVKDNSTSPSDQHGLLALKQEALQQLTPLVHQLDQSPEERFRTTMMMIQSTDNQALIKDAYTAAQSITDDKIRAQALLDVINEINYFTQQKK